MKRLFTQVIFLLLFISTAAAQENSTFNASISVNTEVQQSIQLITVSTVNIGSTQPEQREIYINPVTNLNAGFMIAVGTPRAEFRLNYLEQQELTQVDGEGTLLFTYQISGAPLDNQDTSELLTNDNRNIQFNNDGRFYFWVGGRIDIRNANPGNYEGDFTIEIDYI